MPRVIVRGKKKVNPSSRSSALVQVDNRPLQRDAWKRLSEARARLEKVQAQIRQFEQEDVPAFRRWLHVHFPTLVSAIREAALQVFTKDSLIEEVRREARMSGLSAAAVWARRQRGESSPPATALEAEPGGPGSPDIWDEEEDEDDDWDGFIHSHGLNPGGDDPRVLADARRRPVSPDDESGEGPGGVKQIYRRLVQRLHPDNGGPWTTERADLWHQVQQAWVEGDEALLSRLADQLDGEEGLSPSSSVGSLRSALKRASKARWSAEHTLRAYRMRREWRFSTRNATEWEHRRQQQELEYELSRLRGQLTTAEDTLRRWDQSAKLQFPRAAQRRRRAS